MVQWQQLTWSLWLVGGFALWYYVSLNGKNCLLCMGTPHYTDGCMHDVNHPLFNAREASKQIVLLEQHLFDPRQRCVAEHVCGRLRSPAAPRKVRVTQFFVRCWYEPCVFVVVDCV
jgi:hypothetical protein